MQKQTYAVTTQRRAVKHQYSMRRESPPSFFSWPGWLWLLGLLLLAIWGIFVIAPDIERQVQHSVAQQLAENKLALDFDTTDVASNGQFVAVSAVGDVSKESLAEAIASSAKCDTLVFGELTCPIDVAVDVSAKQQPATAAPATVPDTVINNRRAHNFVFTGNPSGIVLVGELPSLESQNGVMRELSQIHSQIDNQLTLSGEPSSGADLWAATQAGQLLGLAEQGRVSWADGKLDAQLLAKTENSDSIRALFSAAHEAGHNGELELQLIETVSRCDKEFAQLLSENSIRFNTGSATISPDSNRLLGTIAELASNCDMRLDVEGHTDSVGSAEMNKSLSLARANAVIISLAAQGANPERFTPYGYGPDKPIADNATADGRRQNRRIEIRVTKIN